MEYEVFIAYAHEDIKAAQSVVAYLAAAGLHCWWDDRLVPGTPEWEAEIERAIRHTGVFIALISPHSVMSRHVKTEMTLAGNAGKAIIPVFLSEHVDLPNGWGYRLALHQHLYALPSLEAVMPKLAAAVDQVLDSHRHAAAYRDEKEVRQRANFSWQTRFAEDTAGLYVGESEGGFTSIEDGAYVMASKSHAYLGSMIHALPSLTEFILEARLTKLSGPNDQWFGFEFGDPWPQNYYQFFINGQRTVRIAKHWNREWVELARHEGVRQLNPGDALNLWKIVRKGSSFHLFINGLHAQSVTDGDIKVGTIGVALGPDLRVAYSELLLNGISLEATYKKALDHWENLEIKEARQILKYVLEIEPSNQGAANLLLETRADYREGILIVIGYEMMAQVNDGIPAARLREEIDKRGQPHELRWAAIVTDIGLLGDQRFLRCPVIAVGGPFGNKVTALFGDQLSRDPASTEEIVIQHDIGKGNRRVALWGTRAIETAKAVELFISSGLLDRFLEVVWK